MINYVTRKIRGLTILSIENKILAELGYENFIINFAS